MFASSQIVRTVEAAGETPEYKTVAYSQVVPWLVEGVKQQEVELKQQEHKIGVLEAQLAAEQQRTKRVEAQLGQRLADLEAKLARLLVA